MKLLSKVNHTTRKHLGSTGRPIATAAIAGVGLTAAASRWDIETLQNPYTVAAIAIVGSLAIEAGLYFFGDDTGLELVETADIATEIVKLTDAEYESLMKAVKSGIDDEQYEKVELAITALRSGNVASLAS